MAICVVLVKLPTAAPCFLGGDVIYGNVSRSEVPDHPLPPTNWMMKLIVVRNLCGLTVSRSG
jgi:hypothetical protein